MQRTSDSVLALRADFARKSFANVGSKDDEAKFSCRSALLAY